MKSQDDKNLVLRSLWGTAALLLASGVTVHGQQPVDAPLTGVERARQIYANMLGPWTLNELKMQFRASDKERWDELEKRWQQVEADQPPPPPAVSVPTTPQEPALTPLQKQPAPMADLAGPVFELPSVRQPARRLRIEAAPEPHAVYKPAVPRAETPGSPVADLHAQALPDETPSATPSSPLAWQAVRTVLSRAMQRWATRRLQRDLHRIEARLAAIEERMGDT